METYCVKCKSKTGSKDAKAVKSGNRTQVKSICTKCGSKKSTFVSSSAAKGKKGAGFLSDLLGTILPF